MSLKSKNVAPYASIRHTGDMFPSCKNNVYNVPLTGSEDTTMDHSSQAWNVLCLIWLLIIVIMINTFQYGLFSLCLDNVAKLPFFPSVIIIMRLLLLIL